MRAEGTPLLRPVEATCRFLLMMSWRCMSVRGSKVPAGFLRALQQTQSCNYYEIEFTLTTE